MQNRAINGQLKVNEDFANSGTRGGFGISVNAYAVASVFQAFYYPCTVKPTVTISSTGVPIDCSLTLGEVTVTGFYWVCTNNTGTTQSTLLWSGAYSTTPGNALEVTGKTMHAGHVGIGTAASATHSLDVSGSVNANSISVGGFATTRQFDSGKLTTSSTGSGNAVSFNFTFNNIPIVVVSVGYTLTGYVFSYSAVDVTKTGFTILGNWYSGGTVGRGSDPVSWIAIG